MPQFPSSVKSKLPQTPTTIFTTMTALANQHNAINLSQGFPDFLCSPELIDLVNYFMKKGENQYAPMQGMPVLREILVEKIHESYGASFDPETEITITAGGTQAIYTAITAMIHEGDEVIVFTPAYDCYVPAIRLSGGIPIFVQMKPPDFKIDWEGVRKLMNQRTKMIIINTPHNPTGSVLTQDDMHELIRLTKNTEVVILSDEVYEHIIYDGLEHQSVLKFPELAERSFVVFSFGKTYHVTGWKMGYCVAPGNLMHEFRLVHQYQVFSVNRPLQLALAEFSKKKEEYLHLNSFYQQKRDFFVEHIKDSRFSVLPCSGTYFQLLGYDKITTEGDQEFAVRLTKEMGVASIPISVFYNDLLDNKILRFCFAKSNDTLQKAAELLCRI